MEDVLGTSESGDQQIEADVATDDLTKEDGAETRDGERQLGDAEAKSPSSEDTSTQEPPDQLALARLLLQMAFAERIPTEPLGPDTVPSSVLELPIFLATQRLITHANRSRHRKHSSLYPPPLYKFRSMGPEKLREAREQFNASLWRYPDHELVTGVKALIIEKNPDIVDAIRNGDLYRGKFPSDFIRSFGKDAPRVLAAVLWATGFADPGSQELFRLLVPIAANGTNREPSKIKKRTGGDSEQVNSLRAANQELKQRAKKAQQAADEANGALQTRDEKISVLKQELDDARRGFREATSKAEVLEARISVLGRELDDALGTYDSVERDANKLARINADLHNEVRRSQQSQHELEVQRAELAGESAALRRQLEQLKLEVASAPQGPDAVWNFVQDREKRLDEDELITAGGDRERVKDEWPKLRQLKKAFLAAYPSYSEPRPRLLLPRAPLCFTALGGSAEIGRSCYLLDVGNHRLLVDCGIKPNGKEDLHPVIDQIGRLDALILTHAHTDHVGWVPALVRQFPDLEIYCSRATAALLPVMLEDCRKHYSAKLAVANKRARYSGARVAIDEEYDVRDMVKVSKRTVTCDFDSRQLLPFGGLSLEFYRAGHILGASSVLVEDQSGRRVFFSGDFSSAPQLTVPAAQWPELGKVDLFVMESTYGGRPPHPDPEDGRRHLVSFVRQTTERGGSVILASFALGRAQELLKILLRARDTGDLTSAVPIYVDGMINRINPVYEQIGHVDLSLGVINDVAGEAERRETIAAVQRTPSIILTTSGMLTGGPAVEYAQQLLPEPRHRIVFTGYQDEGAPSKSLRDLKGTGGACIVTLDGEDGEPTTFKAAKPAEFLQLSSHADQPGLLEYSRRLSASHIALVHGNPTGQEELRKRLTEIHPRSEIVSGPAEPMSL